MVLSSSDADLIDLLDQVSAGSHHALKRLYELTSGRLYGLALRVVQEPQWAEDAL